MSFRNHNIEKKFHNIYDNFYKENDLVLSAYFSLKWLPSGMDNISKMIFINTKTPFRILVGFKKRQKGGIKINSVLNYEKIEERFEKNLFSSVSKQKNELEDFLNKLNKKLSGNNSYEINILSEVPRGHGLGFSGNSGSLIVSGLYLLNGKINTKLLENFEKLQKFDIFEEIRTNSLKYEFISRYGNTPGESSFNCFINHNKPQIYITEDTKKDIKLLNKIKYNSFNLYEKLNINPKKDLEIDYYLIFSGLKSSTFEIENSLDNDKQNFKEIQKNISKIIKKEKSNFFIENLLKNNKIYENITNNLVISSAFLLDSFIKTLQDSNEQNIENFIENINKINYSLKLLNSTIDFGDLFKAIFNDNKVYKQEKIGLFPMYSGKKGGGYLVVTKKEISKKTIEYTLEKIKKDYPNSYIEYSNMDLLEENKDYGIKIEQFTQKNIFSKYITNNLVLVEQNGEKKFIEYNKALKIKSAILIDTIKRKIYIAGNKLNYKQIHSQNTTIDILEKLYNSKDKKISNKDLYLSSYRTNKNEMNGKIIYPFQKLVFEYLNIDFPLSISGTLSDFMIQLCKTNLDIVFIKQIDVK